MSTDMFMFDEADYSNLATNMISHDGNFFTDPISSLSDSSIDTIFQEFPDELNNTNYITNSITTTQTQSSQTQSVDQIISINSPPSHQLQTLSLQQQQQTHYANMLSTDNYSVISESVKTEDFQMGFDYPPSSYSYTSFYVNSNSYDDGESMLKFMQRSLSSNCFKEKPSYWYQPKFNALMELQNYQPEIQSSLCNGQMRRVCSTGDLPKVGNQLSGGGGEGNMEEGNFKVGKYSAEERKERIDRYRAKRTLRNFNKTIKYACRKTLADNRPRIRGRFARNDETGEIPKNTCFNRYEDDDDPWADNLQEEEEGGLLGLGRGGRPFLSHFGVTNHFQYCGY